jgi:hypothetical protein
VIRLWRDTDHKITFCYNEAKDNAKFIQAMEKCCHSLYLDDPVKIKDSILSLLQTVRLIHSVSQFYNTSERISSLMVKVRFEGHFLVTSITQHHQPINVPIAGHRPSIAYHVGQCRLVETDAM